MSGTVINADALARYARDPSIEIRMRSPDHGGDAGVVTQTGSLGGRLVRNLAITFGSGPTIAEKAEIMAAKRQTLNDLKAAFGDDIGEKAFRAHIGRSDGQGGWITSAAHPITGRHITAMIKTAQQKMAAKYDDSRMQQISIGGMAGPFSKSVCKAATVDWFRRIDNGQTTWRHEGGRQLERNGIDWEQKRARLQAIQERGQGADPLGQFNREIYIAQQPLHHTAPPNGKVGLDKGNEFADRLFASAKQRFQNGTDPNQFWQLNVNLAGRVYGSVGNTIGIHVTQAAGGDPDTTAGYRVHVFDANDREAVDIPGEKFGAWLSSHLTTCYGDRVQSMMLCDVTKEHPRWGPAHPEIRTLKFVGGSHPAHVAQLQAGEEEEQELRQLAEEGFVNRDNRLVLRGEVSDSPPGMEAELPAMPAQFWKDVDRQEMLVRLPESDGPVRLTKHNEPETMVAELAGSSEAAGHLAKFMTQDFFSGLNVISTKLFSEGRPDSSGLISAIPVSAQMMTRVEASRTRELDRDYVELAYTRRAPVQALSDGGEPMMLDEGQSRMQQSMRLRIAVDDLAAGRTSQFEIVDTPRATVRAVFADA